MTSLPSILLATSLAVLALGPARQKVQPSPTDLRQTIASLTNGFQGKVFIYARNLDSGADFALRADDRVRTASTIKLPRLCALAARVAAGRMKWDDPVTIHDADKVSGSGILGEFSEGT